MAWDLATSSTVKVAVVDNGVEYFHPDLSANFVGGDYGYDFVGGDNDPRPDNTLIPQSFHGTHVSGIVAAGLDNGVGVAGWVRTQLYAVRVLNDSGSGTTTDVASGIRWATDRGARVVNMSLGASSLPTHLLEACRYAYDRNVLLVAAAGNEGTANINYPAALAECVCVGATDTASKLASFSNFGSAQEIVAPGVAVFATGIGGTYVSANGTSMATPHVSGVAALVLGVNSSLSASRVRAILAASAIDMGSSGRDATYGYGLANARRALELAQAAADGSMPACPTRIVRKSIQLPTDTPRAVVCDAAGRKLAELRRGASRELRARPGAYFLLVEDGSGSVERLKVVIPD
ncbi:MAG: S8 family serine peptidase, partial [candidate division WOR-3 bacterium]